MYIILNDNYMYSYHFYVTVTIFFSECILMKRYMMRDRCNETVFRCF